MLTNYVAFTARDDLRLPRYLEKEKRERADAKERDDSRDPECPRGHVLMSEPDRLAALATAKNRGFRLPFSKFNAIYIFEKFNLQAFRCLLTR